DVCASCPDDFASSAGAVGCFVAPVGGRMDNRDYGYLFWPTNHWYQSGNFLNVQHVQTGFYGLALDVGSADLTHLGLIDAESSAEEALHQNTSVITDLPSAAVTWAVTQGTTPHAADAFLNETGGVSNPSRLIDMGRFMQRVDIPEVTYAGTGDLSGSIELAAMTRHFVLTHRATSAAGGQPLTVSLQIAGDAVAQFATTEWLDGTRAVSVLDDAGKGWSFIITEQAGATPEITRSPDGTLTFDNAYDATGAGQQVTLSVIAVPSNAGNTEQLSVWLHPHQTVQVQFAQLNRDGSGGATLTPATFDPERGLYLINLHNLSEVGGGGSPSWGNPDKHNWYNRHRLVINNTGSGPISVPLAFDGGGNAAYSITAGSPLLRDTDGQPVGAPIQISKNWHDPPAWYHLYSALQLAPGSHELEHTFPHAKWGETYAAAHAQLSLIGWGQNQQWDQSSLGAWGESITYDPDMTLNRAMVDDVRPFLVETGSKWNWTGNVGGASFLVYDGDTTLTRADHQLGRLRSHYNYTGPNLTDVVYAGITRDNKISARIATQLGRTDDMVRAYYHLEYTFHEDVNYDRLALFQMAADAYGDNGFRHYSYGNAAGVAFDADVPQHGTTGYASPSDRGIPLPGDAPWVMLYDSNHMSGNLPEHLANLAFVVRSYEAQIGDTTTTTPHINIVRTNNGGWSQMAFELGVPWDAQNPIIPAGSVIKATVEYLIPPADKSTYYGASDYLTELEAWQYQSTDMALTLAADNQLEVVPFVGTLVRTYPIEIHASPGATAARFMLSGGLGYTPLTIKGLARPDGWRLEQQLDGVWQPVDQSVEGNDFWQANDDPASGTFELIFNLHNRGTNQYRLIRGDTQCVGVLTTDAAVCDDVDECATGNGGCAQQCSNLEATFVCSCDAGYVLNADGLACDDVDECATANAGCAQQCDNTTGSFVCSCAAGYTPSVDLFDCDDIDECADPAANDCGAGASCSNASGSYVCGCESPGCTPEGCTNPDSPGFDATALLDDGSCFVCSAAHAMGSRVADCAWDCDAAWGECFVMPGQSACAFYYCEPVTSCTPPDEPTTSPYSAELAAVLALGALTDAPTMRANDTTADLASVAAGESKAIFYDTLDYADAPTRAFARIALPAGATVGSPVPGIVLVHGGGGTAYQDWVDLWTQRGYAAISIAVEGQTDTAASQVDIDAGNAVGSWLKHAMAGPPRAGAYGDTGSPLAEQWMYHAVADTVLANSLLRALPQVDAGNVGVMGISWGGVITATVMGIDERFAFAIPAYGTGHKYDIPNTFESALENNALYRQVWDPIVRIDKANAPALWLSWPDENNFSHDAQAATYLAAPGPRMVSLIPGLGHGHSPAWNAPDSYDFADSVTATGQPWAEQLSADVVADVAQVVFTSEMPVKSASLITTTGFGWTGDLTWLEVAADALVEAPAGTWTATVALPAGATAWWVNLTATGSDGDVIVSSDYREVIDVQPVPAGGLNMGHPSSADQSVGTALVSFTGPSYVEIVDVTVHNESHPGAFCSGPDSPLVLKSPAPAVHAFDVVFDNTVAGLNEGQSATGTLTVVWANLDGTTQQVEWPLHAVAQSSFEIIYDVTAPWSSKTVYSSDDVTIAAGAVVSLDVDQSAAGLNVSDGTLTMDQAKALTVSESLTIAVDGTLEINTGVLTADVTTMTVDGTVTVDGGTLTRSMAGISRAFSGNGLIDVQSGSFTFIDGAPSNILQVNTDIRVSGGNVSLSGQIYIGNLTPTQFQIVGDQATVSISRLNLVGASWTPKLDFVLNETGVSKIQVAGWANLTKAIITVDGSAYTGGPTTMLLVDSNNLVGLADPTNITLVGFTQNATVVQDQSNGKDWLQLVID
ncbi:MAG: dienelactone hydrolase, partial [Myxococcota bacterium]